MEEALRMQSLFPIPKSIQTTYLYVLANPEDAQIKTDVQNQSKEYLQIAL